MVKDFLRKLVALVAILFLFCLAFCPILTVPFSNELVETLFKSKAVWLSALVLALGSAEKKETHTQSEKIDNACKAFMEEPHQSSNPSAHENNDDETLIFLK